MSPRSLTITVSSVSETKACSVAVTISPLNDHHPVVDLNGPTTPSINYTSSVNYSIFTVNRAALVSSDVIISDNDISDVVRSVEMELVMGREGDRLVLSEEVCMHSLEAICHLRYIVNLISLILTYYFQLTDYCRMKEILYASVTVLSV